MSEPAHGRELRAAGHGTFRRVAAGNETPPGFPGMAHAQEHMAFRGCTGMSADQTAGSGSSGQRACAALKSAPEP